MKITIYEVAKRAGVSISTASKALNDKKDVGESTKQRVREIAKELSYEPSHFARALARRKTDNIGVITVRYYKEPMITNPFYAKIMEGIEEELINNNLNLLNNILRKEQMDSLDIPKMVKEKNVDGIILLGHMPEPFVRMVSDKGLPVVMIDNYFDNANISTVIADNIGGAFYAVEYIIRTGHKKIAYLAGLPERYSFKQREQGFRQAMKKYNLPIDERFVIFNEKDDQTLDWTKKILSYETKPDAIFCCNDITALLAINMLKDSGLRVPDDVSVMGFDNIDIAEHFIPSISTVDLKKQDMGIIAARKLINTINQKDTAIENIVFPTTLIIRDSTKK